MFSQYSIPVTGMILIKSIPSTGMFKNPFILYLIMNDEELLNELIAQNTWWATGKNELPAHVIERNIFPLLKKELKEKEVVGLVGLRSVGKTTIMKQLISYLLLSKTNPKHILYFSFDGFKKEEKLIRRVLTLYSHNILKKTFEEIDTEIYLFFDEVQKIGEWGEEIKSYYDKSLKMKFFISGSSSMNILRGSGESLVGRIIIHKIYPFVFREFLAYNHLKVEKVDLWNPKYPIEGEKLSILFEEYAKIGGFPILYDATEERKKPLLKSMVDLTFYRDIVNIFDVKRTDILEGLFYIFAKESGNVINYANLSSSLKTKFETVKSYMDYLNSSFLISRSSFYSGSKVKSLEKNEKIYVADHAFNILQETKEGNKIEAIVYNTLKTAGFDLFYWQDNKKKEVDIIALGESPSHLKVATFKAHHERSVVHVMAIEVKYQHKLTDSDLEGLYAFMEKYKLKRAIVVTKNLFEIRKQKGREIHYVPIWLFLLFL